jgi:hypothetical protein
MQSSLRTFAALILSHLALPVAAQGPVVVHVAFDEPPASAVIRRLSDLLGERAEVRRFDVSTLAEGASGVVVGSRELALWRLARDGRLAPLPEQVQVAAHGASAARFVLAWSQPYALLYDREVLGGGAPASLEELALLPDMTDRLGLLPAGVDEVLWLAGMEDALTRGLGEAGGYALWTTLDARAGRYARDLGELLSGFVARRILAAVVPRSLGEAWQQEVASSPLGLADLGSATPMARYGVAILGEATDAVSDVAVALLQEPGRTAVGLAAGLQALPLDSVLPAFDGERVERWLRHYEQKVQGKGREVEGIADMLDLVFTLGFVLVVLGVVHHQRRRKEPGAR